MEKQEEQQEEQQEEGAGDKQLCFKIEIVN